MTRFFIWNCQLPRIPSAWRERLRDFGTYASGALFTIGWWFFIDGLILSRAESSSVTFGFEDWIPGILCTLGMIVTNSIDLSLLRDDSFGYGGGSSLAGKAKLTLFIGIALLAGGVAGSLTILVIKYIVPQVDSATMYVGATGVLQAFGVLLASVVLWFVHNSEYDSQYNFVLN
ncbi:hypothetical protein BX661DRAFT_165796 [Kickxella alabastrina]|uniref:uncharacterized protein n=1 Tax=Kickxella alabastrina TaxID=61397 RepID=UPI00221F009A|nr:uncharacterized protein BX661DRAFT_165796 [Kickxella alabastrina]KAI7821298.1 hypothetical protein BX661DRAFT_165796 [Kickxella alabastrina]